MIADTSTSLGWTSRRIRRGQIPVCHGLSMPEGRSLEPRSHVPCIRGPVCLDSVETGKQIGGIRADILVTAEETKGVV